MSALPDNALLQWLQDESNSEHGTPDALAAMYAYFAADANDPTSQVQDDDRHHCFIIFQKDAANNPTCTILHHLAQFPTRMGHVTLFDGDWFFTGDQPVGGNQITYKQPTDLFSVRNEAQVYTPERIQREIANTPELNQLTVIVDDANVDDLVMVTTRKGMWIPNKYAALCLEDGLSPVAVWNRVYPALLHDGVTTVCSPLVQYLQYQLLGASASNDALYTIHDLLQPRATSDFLRHRAQVLSHLSTASTTPGRSSGGAPAGGPPGGAFGMDASQFQAFIAALRTGHTTPAPTAGNSSSSNTVEKRWSINLSSLLKLTQTSDVKQLPPVWGAIAKGPRKDERNILQAALDDRSRTKGAATNAKLTVSKELLSTVVNLSFWAGDFDMLEEGLHPFRTVYVSTAKQAQDQAHLQTYDSLAQDGTLRLEDVQLFQLVLKSNWPTDYLQLDTSLRLFHNLLAVLLPITHPLVVSYDGFLVTWKSMHILLAEYFSRDTAKPSQFLRSLQLRVALYWQSLSAADASTALMLTPPNFQELLMSVNLQSWVPPTMPGQSMLPSLQHGRTTNPPAAPAPAPSPSPAPAPAPAPGPAAPRQVEVRNPRIIPEIASAMQGRTFRIRDLFDRSNRPPNHADGRPMCCVYHLLGRCSNTCTRAYSHASLNTADAETLKAFVQDRIVARNIGRQPEGGNTAS